MALATTTLRLAGLNKPVLVLRRSPPPATVGVLAGSGIPTFDAGVDGEFVTPTGACLAAALAGGRVARWPSLVVDRVSYGAGTKTWPDRPNLLRVVAGTAAGEVKGRGA